MNDKRDKKASQPLMYQLAYAVLYGQMHEADRTLTPEKFHEFLLAQVEAGKQELARRGRG